MIKDTWVDKYEIARTYHFPGGESVVFEQVTRLKVSESGTHYLEFDGGRKAIVHKCWSWVEIAGDWQ